MTHIPSTSIFSPEIQHKFDIHEFRHAGAILKNDFPEELEQLSTLLQEFQVTHQDITTPGGRKSPIATKFDSVLYGNGWKEKKWEVDVLIDGVSNPSPTHNVDYYKNKIAVELEWNNKDPFFDRDLNNFRLLHQIGVVSVGIIVTRADELQELFNELGKGSSYGASTTHLSKLMPKIIGGGAAECPLLVVSITKNACVPQVKEELEEVMQES
jgi:hypothetical protein